jgi:hypothetical protein
VMWWSPTVRRTAIESLAHLWRLPDWRSSAHASEIRAALVAALADEDEVNRLHSAQVTSFLHHDDDANIELIHKLLLAERHPWVAAALMAALSQFRGVNSQKVDIIVGDVITVDPWAANEIGSTDGMSECTEVLTGLILYLALRSQTPTAVRLADEWFRHPTASRIEARAISSMRPWLELGPDRLEERTRAFNLLRVAAAALENERRAAPTNEETIRAIHRRADSIVSDIYFASGAYNRPEEGTRPPEAGFATEAFETLQILSGFTSPQTVHHAVETLAHLAAIDPPRAFLVVASFVKAGDAYTYDSLAADVTLRMVERYLAEFREHAVANAQVLTAIHSVLDAFVRAGWPAGVSLSYRLGDAFR